METPPVARQEVRPLGRTEVRMPLKAARPHRLYALWLLLVSTGLCRGEALALTWDDIGPDRRRLRVRRNLRRIKKEPVFGTPKTARSQRTISLPRRCVDALREHRAAQRTERAVAGMKWDPLPYQPSGLVFTTPTGRPTDPRSLNRMLTVLCRTANVRRCGCTIAGTPASHSCRLKGWAPGPSWRRWVTARSP
ncbi:tyrosine-type recombinase/integrase [Streptomyces megasporus]|uniref:tyrosine-type recombinase/integrase n=1 Tax=Streptomyces megasporus TaxID=44060 RepID=UPI000B06AA3D|nr:tyrosine-type recombinase/integrase [Streptomyces megasporus]